MKKSRVVSVVEVLGRQVLPLLLVAAGIGVLADQWWVHKSHFAGSFEAVILCGILAAGVQGVTVLLVRLLSARPRLVRVIVIDAVVVLLSFGILDFGEYIFVDLLQIPSDAYRFDPGIQVNTVTTCVAAVAVLTFAFYPRAAKREEVEAKPAA